MEEKMGFSGNNAWQRCAISVQDSGDSVLIVPCTLCTGQRRRPCQDVLEDDLSSWQPTRNYLATKVP